MSPTERLGERVLRDLVSLGLTPSSWPGSACGTALLEVKGRRSGRLHSTLVTWVEHEGARYLVSMPSRVPEWVRNMRAGGGTVVLRQGRRRETVRLEELPVDERAPALRAWYAWTALSPVPRRHFGIARAAPIDAFERIAAAHPVFRIVPAAGGAEAAVGRVTRDVTPSAVRDLLDDPPRATVAFVERDVVALLPVRVRQRDGRQLFGVFVGAGPDLHGREVLLVMDAGAYWFELRGISVRGLAERAEPAGDGSERLAWYRVTPGRVLAWDYDTLREA